MRLKIGHIVSPDFQAALRNLSAIAFPSFKDNWAIAKTLRQITDAQAAYNKTYMSLLEKHGTPDKPGSFRIPIGNIKAFESELQAVKDEEVELDLDHKLALPDGVLLSGKDLFALADMIAVPD